MKTNRFRRGLLAALVIAAVAVPVSAAARPETPAPQPVAFGASATPEGRYAANRENAAEAARMAEDHGDRKRASRLRALAAPDRQLLAFDGRGSGRTVEVLGDLGRAERIAVLVPGADTSIDTYGRLRAGATALHDRLGPSVAVVAWLGYETPGTISSDALTPERAEGAAPALRDFVRELRRHSPRAEVSALCHSYGSVVCAHAARGLDVDDLVLYGSPGTGFDSVAELGTGARVWAGRGGDDWIADVPHTSVELFGAEVGFGTDPVSPAFGARSFDAGDGGHSDYLRPGSESLAGIARIVRGQAHA
ncbi:alpha/beta hydrolase [Streptomyces sp. NPDC051907]|uniref:alpha/beta hydrolase n=1 Tax=Streptomyces sp. NPDC051907 TaxID=3155284 RepID=UPI00341B457F